MEPKIGLIKLTCPVDEKMFRLLCSVVSPQKIKRMMKLAEQSKKDAMLLGEVLAKVMIQKEFAVAIKQQEFAVQEGGKPYLVGHPDIHFSISHSGIFVVCAVCDRPVGVDIQTIKPFDENVAKRVCSQTELEQIKSAADRASFFTKLWTQKEAVLKQSGVGILMGMLKECLEGKTVDSEQIEDCWLSVF